MSTTERFEVHTCIDEVTGETSEKMLKLFAEAMGEKILVHYAESIPDGKIWNCHHSVIGGPSHPDKIAGIGLTVEGEVVALYPTAFSVNPLFFFEEFGDPVPSEDGVEYPVGLSEWSCGGVCRFKGDWDTSLKAYNESLSANSAKIVCYLTF